MTAHDDPQFRARFNDLFERAMADAPPAPDFSDIADADNARARDGGGLRRSGSASEPTTLIPRTASPATTGPVRRWVAAATIGLAAAALLAVVIVPNRGNETLKTVDSIRATTPATDPTATDPTTTTATSAEVATEVSTAPSTGDTSTGDTSSDDPVVPLPTTGTQATVVVANDDGIVRQGPDGDSASIDDPSVVAYGSTDGRVFSLRPAPAEPSDPGSIVEWDPSSAAIEPLDLPDPTGGTITLHDVATVNGVVTILYDNGPAVCDVATDECDIVLRTFEPDTGRSTRLVTLNGARARWVTLSLTETGLVVGESAGADGTSFYSGLSGLDVTADVPQPDDLGLTVSLPDCTNCARSYTVDRTGTHLAWIQGSDLVVIDLRDPARRAVARAVVPDLGAVDLVVDVEGVSLDGDEVVGGVAAFATADGASAAVVDLADSATSQIITGRATLS